MFLDFEVIGKMWIELSVVIYNGITPVIVNMFDIQFQHLAFKIHCLMKIIMTKDIQIISKSNQKC